MNGLMDAGEHQAHSVSRTARGFDGTVVGDVTGTAAVKTEVVVAPTFLLGFRDWTTTLSGIELHRHGTRYDGLDLDGNVHRGGLEGLFRLELKRRCLSRRLAATLSEKSSVNLIGELDEAFEVGGLRKEGELVKHLILETTLEMVHLGLIRKLEMTCNGGEFREVGRDR